MYNFFTIYLLPSKFSTYLKVHINIFFLTPMNTVNQTRKAIILTWRKLRGPPPIPIELLLIGEDYPNSNTYFYRGKGNFYTTIIQSLHSEISPIFASIIII